MTQTLHLAVPPELLTLVRLAQWLQAVEHPGRAPEAGPYQQRVQALTEELRRHQGHAVLPALLDLLPAAAEVYENLQYAHAGLCRTPLPLSLSSELAARAALEKLARRLA